MSTYIERPDDSLWILRVRGVLKRSGLDSLQSRYARGAGPDEKSKLLVLLEAFEGWEQGGLWDNLDFFVTHGDSITKIAFVVEARSAVRNRLRLEGLDDEVGGINRSTSLADAVEELKSLPLQKTAQQT